MKTKRLRDVRRSPAPSRAPEAPETPLRASGGLERGALVRVESPGRPVRYGAVLKLRIKRYDPPRGEWGMVVTNQALVSWDEGGRTWVSTQYTFVDE